MKFLAVAGYDQIQEVFRGLEQRGGFKRLLDWLPFAEGVDWKRIRLAMQAWKDRNRTLARRVRDRPPQRDRRRSTPPTATIFLDWIGLEAADVTHAEGDRGLPVR